MPRGHDDEAGGQRDEVQDWTEEGSLPVKDWWGEPDSQLRLLVSVVNRLDLGIGIRISVGAGILSGSLISMSHFFSLLGNSLREVAEHEEDGITSALADLFDSTSTHQKERQADDADLDLKVRHIHLNNAFLFTPTGPPLQVGLWRGRLASISGWSLGNYGGVDDLGAE